MHSVTMVYSEASATTQQCVRNLPPFGLSAYSGMRADDAARPKNLLKAALKIVSSFSASSQVRNAI